MKKTYLKTQMKWNDTYTIKKNMMVEWRKKPRENKK